MEDRVAKSYEDEREQWIQKIDEDIWENVLHVTNKSYSVTMALRQVEILLAEQVTVNRLTMDTGNVNGLRVVEKLQRLRKQEHHLRN